MLKQRVFFKSGLKGLGFKEGQALHRGVPVAR